MSITVEHLNFSYPTQEVLKDINFSISDGELLTVLGANGAGKTTLFRILLGLETNYTGIVQIDGEAISSLSAKTLASKIAYIPQMYEQTFGYTALEMVLMGTTHTLSAFALPGKKQTQTALEAFDKLNILSLKDKLYSRLSGGEAQLVLVARALAQQAKILVLDEPTASLDYGNQMRVLSMVKKLADDGYTIIISTHNPQHALWYADKVLALYNSSVLSYGCAQNVITEDIIYKLYDMKTRIINDKNGMIIYPEKI